MMTCATLVSRAGCSGDQDMSDKSRRGGFRTSVVAISLSITCRRRVFREIGRIDPSLLRQLHDFSARSRIVSGHIQWRESRGRILRQLCRGCSWRSLAMIAASGLRYKSLQILILRQSSEEWKSRWQRRLSRGEQGAVQDNCVRDAAPGAVVQSRAARRRSCAGRR